MYDELRRPAVHRLARETPGQTLQATALVHEAYLRLVGGDRDRGWDGRGHFFAAAAEAMRLTLVEAARRKSRQKRGGGLRRIDLVNTPAPDRMPLDARIIHADRTEARSSRVSAGRGFRRARASM